MPSYVFLLDTNGDKVIDEMIHAGNKSLDLVGQSVSEAIETAHEANWRIVAKHQVPPCFQSAVNERIAAAKDHNVTLLSLVYP